MSHECHKCKSTFSLVSLSSLDVLLSPILIVSSNFSLKGLLSWLPLGWANLSVLISKLEGLDQSEDLLYVSSDWKIIVGGVSKDSISVNDESSSKKVSTI